VLGPVVIDPPSGRPPLLVIDRVAIQPRFWRLFLGRVEPGVVTLRGVHIHAGGQGDCLADLARALRPDTLRTTRPASPRPTSAPPDVTFSGLEVRFEGPAPEQAPLVWGPFGGCLRVDRQPEHTHASLVVDGPGRALHASRFQPSQALLVISGDLNEASTMKLINSAFGDWKDTGDKLAPLPEAPRTSTHEFLLLPRPGSVQSTLRVGRPAVPATHADYIPLQLANVILGGSFDSRITKNIREDKGYTYSPVPGPQACSTEGATRSVPMCEPK